LAQPLAANAVLVSANSVLSFDTTDQSLWGTGTTDVLSSTSTTHFTDIVVPRNQVGDVGNTSVPNPAYATWAAAYAANLIVCLGSTSCASDRTGPAPAATLTSRDGVLVYYDGHFESGINNRMTFDPGSVNAAYDTTASLTANKDSVAAGEMFSLTLSQSGARTSLDTQFSNIDYAWNAFVDMATDIDMSTWVASDQTNYNNLLPIDTGYKELELFGAGFTNDTITARVLGAPLISIDEGVNIPVDLPLVPVGGGLTLALPLYEAGYYTPDLDTSASDSGTSVSSFVGPEDRLCLKFVSCPGASTDLVKRELDLDVLTAWAAGVPLGAALTTFPLGPRIEQNALDADVALYGGYQQQLDFQANLGATLEFSTPAEVEVAPGMFSLTDQVRVGVGDTVNTLVGTPLAFTDLETAIWRENQGEGDRKSTRRFNFNQKERRSELAAASEEERDLEDAEAAARRRAKENDPEESRDYRKSS
jgi:hypothetical protein